MGKHIDKLIDKLARHKEAGLYAAFVVLSIPVFVLLMGNVFILMVTLTSPTV